MLYNMLCYITCHVMLDNILFLCYITCAMSMLCYITCSVMFHNMSCYVM